MDNHRKEALYDLPNTIILNDGYVVAHWADIRDRFDKPMRFVLKKAEEAGLPAPPSPVDPRVTCCPTYHIKGM